MMSGRKALVPIALVVTFLTFACAYVVLPEGLEDPAQGSNAENAGWVAFPTNIVESQPGVLHIDLTMRNETGSWSTMRAADNRPATLKSVDGETTECTTVFVGTGGHRLAPGFQVRGYTRQEDGQPATQLLYVECAGAAASAGSQLLIDYFDFVGEVDYYVEIEESNREEGRLEVNLDEVVTDLTYPIGTPVEGLIQPSTIEITALSDNIVKLLDVQRNADGLEFKWQNFNPSKFALKTHIGIPPVIGEDGIIYGIYETLDIPPVPLTSALKSAEWTTQVPVPADVGGLYILLSVESKKPRTYVNYAVDITDK